jgi:hypothetical protein
MALLTRRPDGSLLVETRVDYFLDLWRTTDHANRLVLEDRRPAVRRQDDHGPTILTIHPAAWEPLRARITQLLAAGKLTHPSRKRLCECCATELTLVRELDSSWVFRCEACRSAEIHSKTIVGGTVGAGEKEKL